MFEEKQFLYQNKIIWLVGIVMCIPIAILIYTFKGITPNFMLQCILFSIILIFLIRCNLYTKIDSSGIYYKMFPFVNNLKFIDWKDIKKIEVVSYDPISEYGGWGVRGFKSNRAYNTHGNMGIRILFNDDNKLLLGTNLADAAKTAIEKLNEKN